MADNQGAVSWERIGDVTVMRFNAKRITDIEFSKQASAELDDFVQQIGGKVIFSLENVNFLSSVGISILVEFNLKLRTAGGRLKIGDIQPLVWDIFRSIELHRAMDLFQTRGEAMTAFNMGQ
ncbi:MAG: STAS domain-containing protein [Planctomycetes bacterium]|nr:STAS domain-containing protein [Planctomycetota bacterium]